MCKYKIYNIIKYIVPFNRDIDSANEEYHAKSIEMTWNHMSLSDLHAWRPDTRAISYLPELWQLKLEKKRTWKELHPCSSISLHPFPCQQIFTQRHDTHTHQEIDGCPSLPRLNEVFSEGEGSVFDENFPTLYGRNRRIERMEDLVHLWKSRSWHIDTCTKVNFDDISSYPSSRMILYTCSYRPG